MYIYAPPPPPRPDFKDSLLPELHTYTLMNIIPAAIALSIFDLERRYLYDLEALRFYLRFYLSSAASLEVLAVETNKFRVELC